MIQTVIGKTQKSERIRGGVWAAAVIGVSVGMLIGATICEVSWRMGNIEQVRIIVEDK